MTTQEIYHAGIALVRKLAIMECNAINKDPNFDKTAYSALVGRVVKFFEWAKSNGKAHDLRYFIGCQTSKQKYGEWDALERTLASNGIKL